MATGSITLEDPFQCSVCLDLFTDPATAPCGHSFCKACIEGYWNRSDNPTCPLCKASYSRQPKLQVNYVLREIVEDFKQRAEDGNAEAYTFIRRPNPESSMRREYMLQKATLRRTLVNVTRQLDVASKAASCYNSNMRRSKNKAERAIQQVESLCRVRIDSVERLRERFMMEAQRNITKVEVEVSRQSRELGEYIVALSTRREELESQIGSTDPLNFFKKLPVLGAGPQRMPLLSEYPKDLLAKPLHTFNKAFPKA